MQFCRGRKDGECWQANTHVLATPDVLLNVKAHDVFFWNMLSSVITLKYNHSGCHCLCSGMGREQGWFLRTEAVFVHEGCHTSSFLAPETTSGQPVKCFQSFEPIYQLRPKFPPSQL